MPFCTQCGHQNPDGARFCSQCGSRLEVAAPAGESPSETTATITFGGPVKEPEHREERALGDADAAAVDALPPGSALLVVQRGPSAGSRFLLDTDVVAAGRHPESEIFLDDVTVSRRHAEFRRTADGFTVADVGSLNGTYVNRDRIDEVTLAGGDEVQIGKYRLGLLHQPRPERVSSHATVRLVAGAAEHRGGARPAARRLPGPEHLQDPVPRGGGADRARAHPVGLPQVLPPGRRAAPLRPDLPARALPPAQGDPRAPRRDRPGARAAGAERRARGRRCRGWCSPATATRPRTRSPPTPPSCGCPAASCSRRPRSRTSSSTSSRPSAWSARGQGSTPYDGDALVVAKTAGELAAFGFEPRHLRAFRTAADREVGPDRAGRLHDAPRPRRQRVRARRGGHLADRRPLRAAARDARQGRSAHLTGRTCGLFRPGVG